MISLLGNSHEEWCLPFPRPRASSSLHGECDNSSRHSAEGVSQSTSPAAPEFLALGMAGCDAELMAAGHLIVARGQSTGDPKKKARTAAPGSSVGKEGGCVGSSQFDIATTS